MTPTLFFDHWGSQGSFPSCSPSYKSLRIKWLDVCLVCQKNALTGSSPRYNGMLDTLICHDHSGWHTTLFWLPLQVSPYSLSTAAGGGAQAQNGCHCSLYWVKGKSGIRQTYTLSFWSFGEVIRVGTLIYFLVLYGNSTQILFYHILHALLKRHVLTKLLLRITFEWSLL